MAHKINLYIISIILLCLAGMSFAAASKEDIKKFPSVSGDIYGQAAPGAKSISINGKPAPLDARQNFHAFINLKAGEKYLVLKINYEGLRIIKKYLVIRRAQVKTFKIFVPKEKIALPARPKAALRRVKKPIPMIKKKIVPKKAKTCEYIYVWEFDRGKLMAVKESRGKYSADIYIAPTKEWLKLDEITRKELQK